MRRWNGWGDDSVDATMSSGAMAMIESLLGPGCPPVDLDLTQVERTVPASRAAPHPLLIDDPTERVRHARGQSFPDLIALRSGQDLTFPDAVAYPDSSEAVRELLHYAERTGASLIPFGGGTSVVGHVTVLPSATPVVTVDLSRLSDLLSLDSTSHTAVFGAGITGAQLESRLRDRGFTLGHFPQSFEYSTLGGWIATRSRGQQAIHYGGIERLFAGASLETPAGPLNLPAHVASSAGLDLRELVLGSEGRLGIITSATVRISRTPEFERFDGYFFAEYDQAVEAVRMVAQARLPVSMLRLSDPTETAVNLASSTAEQAEATDRFRRERGFGRGSCLLIVGVTGTGVARTTQRHLEQVLAGQGGFAVPGGTHGSDWSHGRFQAPYLRNTLWELGYAVDTVETAVDWSRLAATRTGVEDALRDGLADIGEVVVPFTHLSHVYPTGSSIYTTYLFRLAPEPAETLRRWTVLKQAASRAIVAHGGTISHQHGVGLDHQAFLEAEKGSLGLDLIRGVAAQLDPAGTLNPGKLVS